MTDAHFHRETYATFLTVEDCEFRFYGFHPWQALEIASVDAAIADLRTRLVADPSAGVGETGLDRLKTKTTTPAQSALFTAQLALAAELRRPVVLHGAKCWGEVYKACLPYADRIPAFLYHGFSRSTGLLPDIFAHNGFVSLGPALLNDHAVNYHEMAKALPLDRILMETDRDYTTSEVPAGEPSHAELLAQMGTKLAALRACEPAELAAAVAANTRRFVEMRV